MIRFSGCKINAKTTGTKMIADAGIFTGDCWFDHCQYEVEGGAGCFYLTCTGESSSMAGIHIDNCVLYGDGIYAAKDGVASFLQDVFVNQCANDITNLEFDHFSVRLTNCAHFYFTDWWANASRLGVGLFGCTGVSFTGGKVSSIDYQAFDLTDSNACVIDGVHFRDCNRTANGGGIVKVTGTSSRNKIVACAFENTPAQYDVIMEAATVKNLLALSSSTSPTGLYLNSGTGNVFADNVW
jgi:hypothetical protein